MFSELLDNLPNKEAVGGDASTPSSSLDSVYTDYPLLPANLLSSVDKKLISVFNDTVRNNN
eukprot:10938511-Ditylum_brightwellii.AAC.1